VVKQLLGAVERKRKRKGKGKRKQQLTANLKPQTANLCAFSEISAFSDLSVKTIHPLLLSIHPDVSFLFFISHAILKSKQHN